MRKMVESPIQVGNVATPSNETDRLSYLQRIYKLTYLVTRTQMCARIRRCKRKGGHGYQRATDPRTIHIYLRPKRNSRIYFTYALLPPYFQLCGHGPRRDRSGCV